MTLPVSEIDPVRDYVIKQKNKCLMIVNPFKNRANKALLGYDRDEVNMKTTLEHLNFEVLTKKNVPGKMILSEIQEFLNFNDFEKDDCVAFAIFTHGDEEGQVLGSDEGRVKLEKIVKMFTKKTDLANKPKLFFIQACRGEFPAVADEIATAAGGVTSANADVFVLYATYQGFQALVDEAHGSFFIQALCKVLQAYGGKHSLQKIVAKTNQILSTFVAQDKCQVSEVRHTLTYNVYFNSDGTYPSYHSAEGAPPPTTPVPSPPVATPSVPTVPVPASAAPVSIPMSIAPVSGEPELSTHERAMIRKILTSMLSTLEEDRRREMEKAKNKEMEEAKSKDPNIPDEVFTNVVGFFNNIFKDKPRPSICENIGEIKNENENENGDTETQETEEEVPDFRALFDNFFRSDSFIEVETRNTELGENKKGGPDYPVLFDNIMRSNSIVETESRVNENEIQDFRALFDNMLQTNSFVENDGGNNENENQAYRSLFDDLLKENDEPETTSSENQYVFDNFFKTLKSSFLARDSVDATVSFSKDASGDGHVSTDTGELFRANTDVSRNTEEGETQNLFTGFFDNINIFKASPDKDKEVWKESTETEESVKPKTLFGGDAHVSTETVEGVSTNNDATTKTEETQNRFTGFFDNINIFKASPDKDKEARKESTETEESAKPKPRFGGFFDKPFGAFSSKQ